MDNKNLAMGEWLWLDQFTDKYIVEIVSGEVECYIYDQTPDSSLGRYYIGTKTSGSYILNTGEVNSIRSLCIATTATKYKSLSVSDTEFNEEFCQKLNNSLNFINSWETKKLKPKVYKEIFLGQTISLDAGEYLKIDSSCDVVWLKMETGVAHVLGLDMKRAIVAQEWFSLSATGCVYVEEAAIFNSSSLLELLQSQPVSWLKDYLEDYRMLIVKIMTIFFAEQNEHYNEVLRLKEQEKDLLVSNSIAELFKNIIPNMPVVLTPEAKFVSPILVALRLIATHFNIPKHKVKLPAGLEHLTNVDEILKNVGNHCDLVPRKVRLEPNWYQQDQGVLMVFENKQPFAAIPADYNVYHLIDVDTGIRNIIDAERAKKIEIFAYTFYESMPSGINSLWDLLSWSTKNCFKKDYWMLLFTCVIAGMIPIVTPFITQTIFEDIIPGFDKQAHLMVIQLMLVTAVATALTNIVRSVIVIRIKNNLRVVSESSIWLKVLALPVAFFRKYQIGDLAQRMQSIGQISTGFSSVVANGIFNGIFSFWNLFVMMYYSFKLAIVAVVVWFVYLAFSLFFSWRSVNAQREKVVASGKVAGKTLQILTGLSKFRVKAAEERAFYLWAKVFGEERKWHNKNRWQNNWLELVQTIQPFVMNFFIFWLTMYWIDTSLKDQSSFLSHADFMGFNSASGSFGAAVNGLIPAATAMWSLLPVMERLKPILEEEAEVSDEKLQAGELTGNIELYDLSFRYSHERPLVLKNVSLNIPSGKFVAIVGGSGSGKTTLLRLILGLEKIEKGIVQYDGQDLKELDVTSVRRQMGVVMQNGQLMAGSIYSNIVGSLPISQDDAMETAKMVGLADDIKDMPMGINTVVSEGAGNISGGQKQRILIARSIVHRPRIIVFDEATSSLDNYTQAIVSETLNKMRATRIVVAHRLSTIREADLIVVLENGEIVEQGNYEELIKLDGKFRILTERQIA